MFKQTLLCFCAVLMVLPIIAQQKADAILSQNEETKAGNTRWIKKDHSNCDWFLAMKGENPNVHDVQAKFDAWRIEHPKESSLEHKVFMRWMDHAWLYMDADGSYLPPTQKQVQNSLEQNMLKSSQANIGSWDHLGPMNQKKVHCSDTFADMHGGFCERLYINPYDTQHIMAGMSYGGLWVTFDQGITWQLTDGETSNGTMHYSNRDYYYGEMVAHSTNPSLCFAATEAGLLKSTNKGLNWVVDDELNRVTNPNRRPYFITMDPTNADVVLCSFGREIHRSADGGDTWTMVLDNNDGGNNRTGTNQHSNGPFTIFNRGYNFFGVKPDFNNAGVFYVGLWDESNKPKIYRSIDYGLTFSEHIDITGLLGHSLANVLLMETVPDAPDRVFVHPQFTTDSMYIFNDAGLVEDRRKVQEYIEASEIDWLNENVFYTGRYSPNKIWKSTSYGEDPVIPHDGFCGQAIHADVRAIDAVGDIIAIGTDGGIAISTDGGQTIANNARQVNAIDLWGFDASKTSERVGVGCDHGPTMVRRDIGENQWVRSGGADAGRISLNTTYDRWMYFHYGYGYRRDFIYDGYVGQSGWELIPSGIFLDRMQFHPDDWQTMWVRGSDDHLYKSTDNLTTMESLYNFESRVEYIKVSQTEPDIIYVLLQNKQIHKSIDGGITWEEKTPTLAESSDQNNIVCIEIARDHNTIWAAFGNTQSTTKVLKSADGGETWTNIGSANLPNNPPSMVVHQLGTDDGVYLVFPGQDGVWYRNSTMSQFEPVGSGFPMVGKIVHAVACPNLGKLRIGTTRGSYEHDVYEESTTPIAEFAAKSSNTSCSLIAVEFLNNSLHSSGDATYAWTFEGAIDVFSDEKEPQVYYDTPGAYDVTLTVTDAFGNSHTYTKEDYITVYESICQPVAFAGNCFENPPTAGNNEGAELDPVPLYSDTFSISFWVKIDENQSPFSQILRSKHTGDDGSKAFGIGFPFNNYNPNNRLYFQAPGVSWSLNPNVPLTLGRWCQVTLTYSPTEVKIYVDGNDPYVKTGNYEAFDFSAAPLYINRDVTNSGQGSRFKGMVDELAFYDKVLTQDEIRQNMHLTKLNDTDGLIYYHQFDQLETETNKMFNAVRPSSFSMPLDKLIESSAPVGGGTADLMDITSTGEAYFLNAEVTLNFDQSPEGKVAVSRINNAPYSAPTAYAHVDDSYVIVQNWGNADVSPQSISISESQGFSNVPFVSVFAPAHGVVIRAENGHEDAWSAYCPSSNLSEANGGTASFDGSCSMASKNQFLMVSQICASNNETAAFCEGSSVMVDGTEYTTPSTNYALADFGNNCFEATTTIVTQNPLPNVSISAPLGVCQGTTLELEAEGADSYAWANGLGNAPNASLTPTQTDTYTVIGTDDQGCEKQESIEVEVYALPIVAIYSSDNSICVGTELTLNASGADSFVWSNGLGSASEAIVSPSQTTSYSVTGMDVNNCEAVQTIDITVLALPEVVIAASDDVLCLGDILSMTASGAESYTWGNNLGAATEVTTVPTESMQYTLSGTDVNNCSNTAQVEIIVHPVPTIDLSSTPADNTICEGESVTFTATGNDAYDWNNGESSESVFEVSPEQTTTYNLTATNAFDCSASVSNVVIVNQLPELSFSGGVAVCQGGSTSLTVSGAESYAWSNELGTSSMIEITPTENMTLNVIGTSTENCENTASIDVIVNPLPTIEITNQQTEYCLNETVNLSASGAETYTWSTEAESFEITENMTISVTGIDANNCENSASADFTVVEINTAVEETTNTLTAQADDATFQWYECVADDALLIDGATDAVFNPTENGDYMVEVTQNGCNEFSPCYTVMIVGVEEEEAHFFVLFPNPAYDQLILSTNQQVNNATFEIIDLSGKLVKTRNLNAEQQWTIDISELASGQYFVRLNRDGVTKQQRFTKL